MNNDILFQNKNVSVVKRTLQKFKPTIPPKSSLFGTTFQKNKFWLLFKNWHKSPSKKFENEFVDTEYYIDNNTVCVCCWVFLMEF